MNRQTNRIVISGPTGAIGMALIKKCIEKQIYMVLVLRPESKRNDNIPQSEYITIVYADISEYDKINENELLQNGAIHFDAFIHLAWMGTIGDSRNNMTLQTANIQYTLSAVRLAKRLGCKVFMGAGSQAEYGRVEGYLTAKTPAFPENGYGMAKLCAGQMSRVACKQLQMEHVWLRVLSIYGPYDGENTMTMSAIRAFANCEEASFTKGEQKWDYLFSEDAAEMIIGLLQSGQDGKVYCIGGGKYRLLREYIRDIYLAVKGSIVDDSEIGIGKVPYADKQVMFLCADTAELESDIGTLELTPFSEGIRKTVEWYRSK